MRLRSVEENGNVTVITGSFFGNLNLTTHNKEDRKSTPSELQSR